MTQAAGDDARWQFAQLAVQYYVAGRAAAIGQLIPVLGNLLHHAVEMTLKAALASSVSLQDLKKLGHDLPRVWERFKAAFPKVDGSRFDPVVEELHRFEELRYPDSLLGQGAFIELILLREHLGTYSRSPSSTPRYTLVLEDVDELQELIFVAAGLNPSALTGAMAPAAKSFLFQHNRYASKWQ